MERWSGKLFPETEEHGLPIVPAQQTVRQPPTVADDLRTLDKDDHKLFEQWVKTQAKDAAFVQKLRRRLCDLGWFMKSLKEPLARMANRADWLVQMPFFRCPRGEYGDGDHSLRKERSSFNQLN